MSVAEPTTIRTPDQRLRVFISSTLEELADERTAARQAITKMRLTPVMFELGARPHPPRDLYRAYLEQSQIFVAIYWQRYGWVAPGESVSGLEDEYRLSGTKPKLIYIKSPAPKREPRLQELLDHIRSADNASYKSFSTADALQELVENDLAVLLTEHFETTGVPDAPGGPTEAAPHPITNLPAPLTTFIGRTDELKELHNLLQNQEVRLVTLTGPGGVGKTRLSMQIANEVLGEFQDGVFFVALSSIRDPALVTSAIVQTLGIRETSGEPLLERLKDYLRSKHLLLLLDGMEQVLSAASLAATLLAECPGLKILVTSRAPLHIRGESEFPVPPLSLSDPTHPVSLEELSHAEAIQLFVQRALGVQPDFALTETNARAVADICRRLDGLPLAIELAAARIKVLPPQALLARLDSRLGVLTDGARDLPARQQTLRNTIGWSYELLNESEKVLFRRLAVFAGGFTLKSAEEVCNASCDLGTDILDGVTALLDESLLRRGEQAGEERQPRFAMLETIREYAMERLGESGETETIQKQHAEYFLTLAAQVGLELRSRNRDVGLQQAEAEHDNLRAALSWSQTAGGETDLRLVGALWWFWYLGGHWSEGRGWLDAALARAGTGPPMPLRAQALLGAGLLAGAQGDGAIAISRLEESTARFREVGDKSGLAYALGILGTIRRWHGDSDGAQAVLQESVALFRENGDKWGLALVLSFLGETLMILGQYGQAQTKAQESVAISRELGDRWSLALGLNSLGLIAEQRGDQAADHKSLEESLAIFRELGDKSYIGLTLIYLGDIARHQGDYERAAALYQESLALYREIGSKWGIAFPLSNLGRIALARGDYVRARALLEQALQLYRESGNIPNAAACLAGLAGIARIQGQPERAAQLLGAAQALLDRKHTLIEPTERTEFEGEIAAVRAQLGDVKFASARAEGQAMTLEQAVALAPQEVPEK